jgi:hypothetical protein
MTRPWKREITVISEHTECLKVEETHGNSTILRSCTLDDLKRAARAEGYELTARFKVVKAE